MTPIHMIALMSAATTERDIDRHTQPPDDACAELTGFG
jgi:hypothetical protein